MGTSAVELDEIISMLAVVFPMLGRGKSSTEKSIISLGLVTHAFLFRYQAFGAEAI